MRILFNGRSLLRPTSGVERYAECLAGLLGRTGYDFRIVVPGPSVPESMQGNRDLEVFGRWSGHLWEQFDLPRAVSKADLLVGPANTGPLVVRRQLLTVHDLAWHLHPEGFSPRFRAWYAFLIPRLLARVRHVITVSDHVRRELMEHFDIGPDRISVVPPFLAGRPDAITSAPAIHEKPYFLVVAAQDPRKRIDLLLEHYRSGHFAGSDLIIVGRSSHVFNGKSAKLPKGVQLRSNISETELHLLYDHATALVNASKYEGFGLPLLEAMQAGCPVISHDLPVLRELFKDGPIFIDICDGEALRSACERALSGTKDTEEHVAQGIAVASGFNAVRTLNAFKGAIGSSLEHGS
ncbi:MAG: glycosyltransferase family 4 protein [Flavobacteriales bacterium]|nr:glycosyltransferase family 4 protein [Flavobacteriales bacterium]